jgi:hypothetical protein
MKRLILVGLMVSTAATASENVNPSFNFEGLEAFWGVVGILEAGREPTETQWDMFFAAPGYKALTEREFGRAYFQKTLRAVFMPSQSGLEEQVLDEYKQQGGFLAWYTPLVLEGFHEADRDREWMASRVEELKIYPYLKKAAGVALRYLPEDETDTYPEVDFIVFNDSRGYSPLIIGLTGKDDLEPAELDCLKGQGQDRHWPFVLHMAHESFHLYRDRQQEIELPEEDHPDYPVLWTLDQMENEGIGDLINRKALYYGNGCLADTERASKLQEEQRAQPATLRIMDAFLSEMADDPDLVEGMGRQLRRFIPQSGHPTGFFMANIIEEELGTEALVEVVRNPFAFFTLYNKAARKNGTAPVLSSKAMTLLRSLERKYLNTSTDS